jgi:hypothetical protein
MRHAIGLIVLILAAGLFFSCTEGEYEGYGGGGNLVIVDRSTASELNGKFIEVEGTKTLPISPTTVGFDPASKRKKFSGKKLSAPLYDSANNRYTGGTPLLGEAFTVTVKVYEKQDSTTTITSKGNQQFTSVMFYNGSALIEWK